MMPADFGGIEMIMFSMEYNAVVKSQKKPEIEASTQADEKTV